MTFSIVGLDKARGEIGIAICSAIPCVGEYFAFGEAQVGIVAAQGSMNPYNAKKILELIKQGVHPKDILETIKKVDKYMRDPYRVIVHRIIVHRVARTGFAPR